MAHILTSISNSLTKGFLFQQVTRYVNPELLSSALFAFALFGSDLIGSEASSAVADGIIIEFLMIHANVGVAAAQWFSTSEASRRKSVLMVSAFYFLFVSALAFGLGAWWMALCFILLTWSRLGEPAGNTEKGELFREIGVSMARFVVYMLAGLICAGILTGLGADDEFKILTWGMVYFLALFLLRKKLAMLRQSKLFSAD